MPSDDTHDAHDDRHADLSAAIDAVFPDARAALERLVRIPSISAEGYDPAPVRESAETTAALLAEAGLGGVRLLEVEGAPPAVFAEGEGSPGAPTVLLYAHHDVQPPGDESQWASPPFEPVERDGRLYGRGASDDKAGIATHLAAILALRQAGDGRLPCGVKVFVEGEEEIGSPHMADFLARYRDELAAGVIVVADSEHWAVGRPALTTSLRGLVDCTAEVRVLRAAVHSGQFGGAVPDALSALARLLATLHDDAGRVAIEGLAAPGDAEVDLPEHELRAQAGMAEGVVLIGDGPLASRLWTRPAVSVLAIDAPRIAEAVNALIPSARAKVSLRLAPGDDPDRAMNALVHHLERHAPWGAQVTVTPGAKAAPFRARTSGLAYEAFRAALREAWGRDPVAIGQGGTIPLATELERAYPQATVLLTGVGEPTSNIHGPGESQDLAELRRAALAEAIALRLLGGEGRE